MKRVARAAILLIIALSALKLHALKPWWLCGESEAGLEVLYLKPMVSPTNYASQVRTIPNVQLDGQIFPFAVDYQWGIRAHAGYQLCGYRGEVSYKWYQNVTRGELRSNELDLFTINDLGTLAVSGVRGLYVLSFQNIDFQMGERVFCGPSQELRVFLNGGYVSLSRYHRSSSIAPNETNFSQSATYESYRGGLVGFGVQYEASVWCDLAWFVELNPGLTIARVRDYSDAFQAAPGHIKFHTEPKTTLNPAFASRLGLSWLINVRGCCLEATIGYQVDYFWHVFPQGFTNNDARTQLDTESVGFAGPFAGLQGKF